MKYKANDRGGAIKIVAPFVGVWIEINAGVRISSLQNVAPFVGVWIEITISNRFSSSISSLPSWECGLKFVSVVANQYNCSRSLRGSVD